MTYEFQVNIKIIASNSDKIIGWKGDILEICLLNPCKESLISYISDYLNINKVEADELGRNIFNLHCKTKFIESPALLFY